jgi:hypothetical protein
MSFEITTAFVQQFRSTLAMLAQQKTSRLRDKVIYEPVTGTTAWYDQVGTSSAQRITNRQGDTPIANTPHRRRRIDLAPYNWADLIDNADKVRMLTDPTSTYTQAGNAAMNRAIDDIIIAQFFATANTGVDGTTQVTWPAIAQQVVAVNSWAYGSGAGNSGLTISKLTEARICLFGQEAVDDADSQELPDTYIAVTSKQIGNLLSTTEVTSKDFNAVQALVDGKINRFMGFEFVRTERLLVNGSAQTRVPVWQKQGMYLGCAEDLTLVSIDKRPDKNNATQPYYEMVLGAARVEEARVVEIVCA